MRISSDLPHPIEDFLIDAIRTRSSECLITSFDDDDNVEMDRSVSYYSKVEIGHLLAVLIGYVNRLCNPSSFDDPVCNVCSKCN